MIQLISILGEIKCDWLDNLKSGGMDEILSAEKAAGECEGG